jgi:hypothetical protein
MVIYLLPLKRNLKLGHPLGTISIIEPKKPLKDFTLQSKDEIRITIEPITVHGTDEDLRNYADVIRSLEQKAGRLIINGYPTGVEVCHAMVHGGPFPATTDSRTASVGTMAITRFARPVCYQNFSGHLLPDELKDGNPLMIWRLVDGNLTKE